MASLQTFFRTVVMLAALGFIAKMWYHHGPDLDEMKSIGARVSEVVSQEWKEYWQPHPGEALTSDPRLPNLSGAPAPFVPPAGTQPIPSAPQLVPTDANHSPGNVQLAGGVPAEIVPIPSNAWPPGTAPDPTRLPPDANAGAPTPVPQENPRLTSLLEHLTSLGVRDQQLTPWGSNGLTRFTCEAPWANSPSFSRHFEAVAATPEAAVEQVAADIAAWQRAAR
jgi:hypothetical protein